MPAVMAQTEFGRQAREDFPRASGAALSAFDSERLDRFTAAALPGLLAGAHRGAAADVVAREAVSIAREILEEIRRQTGA